MAMLEQDAMRARRFRTPRTIFALMLREMSTTYGRTPGGYLWAILEPVAGIALFTLVLSYGLRIRSPGMGTSFAMFYATGMLPFTMFNIISGQVSRAIPFSRALLLYPGVTYIDAILARFLLSALTQLMVFYIVITGILMFFDTGAILSIPAILTSLTMAMALGFGVGCLNGYLIPSFPIWGTVWSVLTTPLFLLSCILITYDDLPVLGKQILWYNPIVHVVGEMRRGFYATYPGSYVTPTYAFGFSLVCAAFGLMLLRRHHRSILNR